MRQERELANRDAAAAVLLARSLAEQETRLRAAWDSERAAATASAAQVAEDVSLRQRHEALAAAEGVATAARQAREAGDLSQKSSVYKASRIAVAFRQLNAFCAAQRTHDL